MAQCNGDDAGYDQAEGKNHAPIYRLLAKNRPPKKERKKRRTREDGRDGATSGESTDGPERSGD